RIERPPPATVAPKPSRLKLFLEVLGGVSAILGIVGFFLSAITKLSVDSSGTSQASNPMATVFYLPNDGILSLHDIGASCCEPHFKMGNYEIDSAPDARVVFPESKAETLSPGHKMTLPCGHLVGLAPKAKPADITEAAITIIVDYRPDWVPLHRTA